MLNFNKKETWGKRGLYCIAAGICIGILLLVIQLFYIIYQQLNPDVLTVDMFKFFTGSIALISALVGAATVASFKSWDIQGFIQRIENAWTANLVIDAIKRKSKLMGWEKDQQ